MGRKTTLVVSLMTMGVGTFLIGCLPTYDQVGVGAVAILCLLRFIQGIGLGGEWSGAALVATENAPEDKRALYGSFPELGAPIGFFLSNGTYFVLESFNNQDAMLAWGWRVPFLLSAILVIVGLVVARADGGDPDLPYGPGTEEGRQVPADRGLQEVLASSHPGHLPRGRHLHAVLHARHLVPRLGHQGAGRAAAALVSPTRNTCSCS